VERALRKAGIKNPIRWIDAGTKALDYLEAVSRELQETAPANGSAARKKRPLAGELHTLA